MKLKTLEELEIGVHIGDVKQFIDEHRTLGSDFTTSIALAGDLKQEAIKLIKNLQGPDSIYPLILNKVPENIKGSIAVDNWPDNVFRIGSEYGMIAMLIHMFNISKEDLE